MTSTGAFRQKWTFNDSWYRAEIKGEPMLLRRVVEHVKTQNWTAVALDFVIVVVGVFIGIQVANWNGTRADANRAQAYLERLHSDLSTDIANLNYRDEFWESVIAEGNAAIAYAENGILKNDSIWETAVSFFQASQIFPYTPVDPTFQELRSAGDLGLIRDEQLRYDLALYYSTAFGMLEDTPLRHRPAYRDLIRGLTPSQMSRYIWLECHDELGFRRQGLKLCNSPFSDDESQAILDLYMSDPTVIIQLRAWITELDVALRLSRLDKSAATELANRINPNKQPD